MSDDVLPTEAAEALLIQRWKRSDLVIVCNPLETLLERAQTALVAGEAMRWQVTSHKEIIEMAEVRLYPYRIGRYSYWHDMLLYTRSDARGLLVSVHLSPIYDGLKLTLATLASKDGRPLIELPKL